jgi:beta-glucosidase/6-phospho-beta-glucosidase/beta-galactosidase
MAESLRRAADQVEGREVIAAGNLADVTDDGRARPDHLRAVLDLVGEAAGETNVAGWWQSSPIDGYHWERGFSINPGIISADRTEHAAARVLRDF